MNARDQSSSQFWAQLELETDPLICWEMQCGDMPSGCHVLYSESDVMAVWENVVETCPHHLKLDVWYAGKQKVIVWCVPCFTYKVFSFAVVNFWRKSYDVGPYCSWHVTVAVYFIYHNVQKATQTHPKSNENLRLFLRLHLTFIAASLLFWGFIFILLSETHFYKPLSDFWLTLSSLYIAWKKVTI